MIRIVYLLGLCLSVVGVAVGVEEPAPTKVSITPNQTGGLYTLGEKIGFTIKAVKPPAGDAALKSASCVIVDIDGTTIETLPALELSAKNNFSIDIEPKVTGLGYYKLAIVMTDSSGNPAKEQTLSFGIIPDVALKAGDPTSPFGVATHFMRWKKAEAPALQAKLGISWFREELDFKTSASGNALSPLVDLAAKNNLTWLPLINYFDANKGVEVDGVWKWDEDIAKLKTAFEVHKGKFSTYESQNEPNNFGGWTKRFKGPAPAWLADNWGKPFSDLVKAMRKALTEADPQAKMLWPDLDSPAWIKTFATQCEAAPFIDGVAPHPYCLHGELPETQAYAKGSKDYLAMLEANKIPKNIWITEVGYTTYVNPKYKTNMTAYRPLTEPQQAAWLVRTYLTHLGWGVSRIFWYDLLEDGNSDTETEHRFGLLRIGSFTPKPVAVAYANLIYQFKGAAWIASCKLPGNPNAFVFPSSRTGKPVLAAWVTQGTAELSVAPTAQVVNIFGTEVKAKEGKVTITESPLYIAGLELESLELGARVVVGNPDGKVTDEVKAAK